MKEGDHKVEADSDEAAYRRIKEYLGDGTFRKQLIPGTINMVEKRHVQDPPWAKEETHGRLVADARRIYR
jgi:hypothetical protein